MAQQDYPGRAGKPSAPTGVKNPDHEAETPAPSSSSMVNEELRGPGPNGAGNSRGNGRVDPQGQQGSTQHDHPHRG
jgi:hypothetical protein